MKEITLYKTDPAKNVFRLYRLDIQMDLFGNQCPIRQWGRIGERGQMKTVPFPTLEAAEQELAKYHRMKLGKGYKHSPLALTYESSFPLQ